MAGTRKTIVKRKKKISVLLAVMMLITALAVVYLFIILTAPPPTPPPQHEAISLTWVRMDSIVWAIDNYHEALFSDAEAEVVEQAADRAMAVLNTSFPRDWLNIMLMYESKELGIEYLLTLIGSRVAAARNAGDERYERWLEEANFYRFSEEYDRILQLVHASIEYFENQ